MHPARLRAIGVAVWGTGWATALASAVNVHPVTVRRWAAGLTKMSPEHESHIVKMAGIWSLERHKRTLKELRRIKNPYGLKKKDRTLKVDSPVFVKPWKKITQKALILDDF